MKHDCLRAASAGFEHHPEDRGVPMFSRVSVGSSQGRRPTQRDGDSKLTLGVNVSVYGCCFLQMWFIRMNKCSKSAWKVKNPPDSILSKSFTWVIGKKKPFKMTSGSSDQHFLGSATRGQQKHLHTLFTCFPSSPLDSKGGFFFCVSIYNIRSQSRKANTMKAVIRQMFSVRSGNRTRWQILETAHTGGVLSLKGGKCENVSAVTSWEQWRLLCRQQTAGWWQSWPAGKTKSKASRVLLLVRISRGVEWGRSLNTSLRPQRGRFTGFSLFHFFLCQTVQKHPRGSNLEHLLVLGKRIKDWIWTCSGWKISFYPF